MNLKRAITMPRSIGIILILFAVFLIMFSPQNIIQAGLIAIVGLILALAPNDSAKKQFKNFIATFRFKPEFAKIMVYDAIFWVIAGLLSFCFTRIMKEPYAQLKALKLTQESITSGALEQYNVIIHGFLTTLIITLVVLWLLIVIAYSVSRGLVWLTLLDKKLQARFFVRFVILNLAWCTVWGVLGFFIVISLVQITAPIFFIALLLIYTHLTTVMHNSYTKHPAFGRPIAEGFGIGKLGRFIQPYCYIFISYLVLTQLLKLAQGGLNLTITFIAYFAFMAWYRIYMRNILRNA